LCVCVCVLCVCVCVVCVCCVCVCVCVLCVCVYSACKNGGMRDSRTKQRRWTRDHVCKTIQGKVEHGRGRVLRIRFCVREIVARLLTRAGEYSSTVFPPPTLNRSYTVF
jgi:hypothetical protein